MLIMKQKWTYHLADFAVPTECREERKESKKIDDTWTLPISLKAVEYEGYSDKSRCWCAENGPKIAHKGTGNGIVKIS